MGVNTPSQLNYAQVIHSVVEKSHQELIMYIRYLKQASSTITNSKAVRLLLLESNLKD